MLETALARAEEAFTGGGGDVTHAVQHLYRYYDPAGGFAGATFLGVDSHDEYAITGADLWAVSTLSMSVPAAAGRALMNPGQLQAIIAAKLHHLPTTLPMSAVTSAHLVHMENLYQAIRTMLPPLGKSPETNQWVLAAKICARKRPLLFPVRDSKVCTYLADNPHMGDEPGRLGAFARDIQVLAHLITHPQILARLEDVRAHLHDQEPAWPIDWCDLRLLDAVLWMQATHP